MNHIDLFSGIGGFALAAKEVWGDDYHNLFFCDNNAFCAEVIRKNFGKDSLIFSDIRDVTEDLWKRCVQNAVSQNERQEGLIVNRVTQKEQEFGEMGIEKNIKQTQENTTNKRNEQLSNTMAENALVAEKKLSSSLRSTINSTMGTKKERHIRHILGNSLSKEDCQTTTKSSAITATTQKPISGFVLTQEVQVDLLTAGVPCQPASCAGKRRGTKDDRWLWPETFRVISITKPRFVILENVRGLLTLESGLVFKSLLAEMENLGYETRSYIIPACAVNAPHRRDRVWIVAHSRCEYGNGSTQPREAKGEIRSKEVTAKPKRPDTDENNASNAESKRLQRWKQLRQSSRKKSFTSESWQQNWLEVATELCRMDARLSAGVDRLKLSASKHRVERLKSLGNAIVPQCVMPIMKSIKSAEESQKEG